MLKLIDQFISTFPKIQIHNRYYTNTLCIMQIHIVYSHKFTLCTSHEYIITNDIARCIVQITLLTKKFLGWQTFHRPNMNFYGRAIKTAAHWVAIYKSGELSNAICKNSWGWESGILQSPISSKSPKHPNFWGPIASLID